MEVKFSKIAEKELDKRDKSFKILFIKHSEKLAENPFQKHMKHGLPFYAED